MKIQFPIEGELATKVWHNFERELNHKLKALPKSEREDVKLEILSHLYDSAQSDDAANEESRLVNAIDRLGDPESYLGPLIADILQEQKTAQGHPAAIVQSLLNNAKLGVAHVIATVIFGFGYFITLMIFIMSVMHIGDPDVGLWIHQNGGFAFSFEHQPNSAQWMPRWFSLIGILASVCSYLSLSKLLYLILYKFKK